MIPHAKTAIAWLLIGLSGGLANAQIKLNLSGEAGYFHGDGFDNPQGHLAYRVDGQATYQFRHQKNLWHVNLRYRPRFYGNDQTTRITKFSAGGRYWYLSQRTRWGIMLNRQFYNYHNPSADLGFDILQVQVALAQNLKPGLAIDATVRYYYRDLAKGGSNSLDGVMAEGRVTQAKGRYTRITAGWNLERFFITQPADPNAGLNKIERSGWRFGPQIGFIFEKRFLFQFQYRYLFQRTDMAADSEGEHWLRLLFGKILNARWSVFFLLDAYSRGTAGESNFAARYSHLNTENNLYGKIDYGLTTTTSIFIKAEYTRDELQFPALALTSRQLTAGVAFKGR